MTFFIMIIIPKKSIYNTRTIYVHSEYHDGTAKQNVNMKMDWNALDRSWAEQYEEDYGNLFSKTVINSRRINISISNNETGIFATA